MVARIVVYGDLNEGRAAGGRKLELGAQRSPSDGLHLEDAIRAA